MEAVRDMAPHWLEVIGIGEDGVSGLSEAARNLVAEAEILIGGDRHQNLVGETNAKRIAWPSPFDAMIDEILSHRGKRIVILVTGDPLWFSVGARLLKSIPSSEIRFHPQLSAFQWSAARMGWSLADTELLTVHGRPCEQILPFIRHGARLLVLTKDKTTPATIAGLLTELGFGPSEMKVLAALGGENEQHFEGKAENWQEDVPDFHTLAIDCVAAPETRQLPRGPGLPDHAFEHDGKLTKREVRSLTIARLNPGRGELLWDIGLGCGSVAIEWMRVGVDARAIGLEPNEKRRDMAQKNAISLGAPALKILNQSAPEGLAELPKPDAVFIGGGLSEAVFDAAWAALKPHGRLVANAVTLESETILAALHAKHGGDLVRISVARAEPVGPYRGWRSNMPVTQWTISKDGRS